MVNNSENGHFKANKCVLNRRAHILYRIVNDRDLGDDSHLNENCDNDALPITEEKNSFDAEKFRYRVERLQ
jgi:hypothetical protein